MGRASDVPAAGRPEMATADDVTVTLWGDAITTPRMPKTKTAVVALDISVARNFTAADVRTNQRN